MTPTQPITISSVDPSTGETLRTFDEMPESVVRKKVEIAADAFAVHRRTSFAERREKMMQAALILEGEKESFGRLMTMEMGKPLRAAREEAEKCAWACRYFAENAERF